MALNSKQKKILNRYSGQYAWGNLPSDVQATIEKLSSRKNNASRSVDYVSDENVWSDAERYLQDNYVRLIGGVPTEEV